MAETEMKEKIMQKLPYRCPYCDQPIHYGQIDLKEGENPIRCPACKKTYIKIVSNPCNGESSR